MDIRSSKYTHETVTIDDFNTLFCHLFFRQFLETDFSLPQEKVKEIGDIAVAHLNAVVRELRRLFLVEDLVDSIKFGVLLWCLTYLGAWFNGMTLIIIGETILLNLLQEETCFKEILQIIINYTQNLKFFNFILA